MTEKQPSKQKSKKKFWIILPIAIVVIVFILVVLLALGIYFYGKSYSTNDYIYDDDYDYDYGYEYESMGSSGLNESKSVAPMEMDESSLSDSVPSTAAGSNADTLEGELTEQKIIKTGTISLQVEKTEETVNKLTNIAVAKGGFVLSSSVYTSSDETQYGTMTIKVPVLRYEEAMSEIKNLGDIQRETSSGQDVTEQYSDLQAQLKNYQAEEGQYVKILERAESVDDILKVTKQLSIVRENIEVTQGRIKYLEGQTDMSTITISLSEETRIDIPTKEWKPIETLKQAFRTWIQFLQGLINIAIWAIIFLGPVAVLVYIIVKLIIRRARKKKEPKN